METRFSIGEVAKLHNISIQTLRYYDKIGLLKPSYVNEESGYRYYGAQDFILINAIKQCKEIGLSLDEIKVLMQSYTSAESIVELLRKQKELLSNKLEELQRVQLNIETLEKSVQSMLDDGLDRILLKKEPKRTYLKYDNINRYSDEFEVSLSQISSNFEQSYQTMRKELVFTASATKYQINQELVYTQMLLNFTQEVTQPMPNKVTLEAGTYVTLSFNDNHKNTRKYYDQIQAYIEKHHLIISGDFYESYVMTVADEQGQYHSLGKLQILVDHKSDVKF